MDEEHGRVTFARLVGVLQQVQRVTGNNIYINRLSVFCSSQQDSFTKRAREKSKSNRFIENSNIYFMDEWRAEEKSLHKRVLKKLCLIRFFIKMH